MRAGVVVWYIIACSMYLLTQVLHPLKLVPVKVMAALLARSTRVDLARSRSRVAAGSRAEIYRDQKSAAA